MLIYLAVGSLPWNRIEHAGKDKLTLAQEIIDKKKSFSFTPFESLLGRGFCEAASHVMNLGENELPDHQRISSLLQESLLEKELSKAYEEKRRS